MKSTTYEELFNDLADNGLVITEKNEFEINMDEYLNDFQYKGKGMDLIKEMYSIEILEGEKFEECLENGEIFNIDSTLHSKRSLAQKEKKEITLDDLEKGDYIGFEDKLYKITRIFDPTSDYSYFFEFEGSNGFYNRLTKYNNKGKWLFSLSGWEGDINTHWIDKEQFDIVLTAKPLLIINNIKLTDMRASRSFSINKFGEFNIFFPYSQWEECAHKFTELTKTDMNIDYILKEIVFHD